MAEQHSLLSRVLSPIDRLIDLWNPYRPERLTQHSGLKPVEVEEHEARQRFSRAFMVLFLVFLVWALFAPIDNGVHVPGTVAVEGSRKSVQHPTGGIVTDILVREGDLVKAGQVVLRISPLGADTNLTGVDLDYINLLASESRLKSERANLGQIQWASFLEQRKADPRVMEAKSLQVGIFNARRNEYRNSLQAIQTQVQTLKEEYENALALGAKGFIPKVQVNGALRAVTSAETSLAQLKNTRIGEIEGQLAEIQKRREALEKQLKVANAESERTVIRAPVSGNVVGLKVNTVGAVIGGATVLMEIVPDSKGLVLEVQVPPTAIDTVRQGLQADIRFTAFNSATTPVVEGVVEVIGSDRIPVPNAMPGQSVAEYYLGTIRPTQEGLERLGALKIQPGMTADVIIKTGERSFMSYFAKPLTDRLAKAFLDG